MKDYVYVRVYWASICWLENCHGVTLTSTYAIIAVGGRSSLLGGGDIPDVSRLGAPPSLVSSRPSSRAKQGLNALGYAARRTHRALVSFPRRVCAPSRPHPQIVGFSFSHDRGYKRQGGCLRHLRSLAAGAGE